MGTRTPTHPPLSTLTLSSSQASFPFRLLPAGDKLSCGCTLRQNEKNFMLRLHFFGFFVSFLSFQQSQFISFIEIFGSFMISAAGSSKWTRDCFMPVVHSKAVKRSGDDFKSRIRKSAVCRHTSLSPSHHQLLPVSNESQSTLHTLFVPIATLPTEQQLEAVSQTCREKPSLSEMFFFFFLYFLCSSTFYMWGTEYAL